MTPDTLASILDANPYPGCVVTRADDALRLDFDGLILIYRADGWNHGGRHLACLLSNYSTPERVKEEIRRVLTLIFGLSVGQTLNREDPVGYLTNLAAKKMLSILDVAALANARQAEIGRLSADVALLTTAIEATHKIFDGVGVAWSTGADAGRLPLPKRAEYAVSPGFLADAERNALDQRITDLERDLTTKADTLKTAHAALTRICDVIGAPIPGCPDDVVEAVAKQLGDDSDAEHRAKTAEQALKDINLALLDVQAPRAYRLADNTERPISDADRVRILGDRVRGEWREKERVSADHSERGKIIGDAHLALDDLKAPRLADGITLTPAARIRALPR